MAYVPQQYFQQTKDDGYVHLSLRDDHRSVRSSSFASDEPAELEQYHDDSSQTRLRSLPLKSDEISLLSHTISNSSRIPARSVPGLWKNQMLVDRTLRSMALLTSVFALIMIIIVFAWLPKFIRERNITSTSVLANAESCTSAANKILVIHLFVNIAATMVLGMSNTYQQLVTALDAEEIPDMLRKLGDCKVGTNSPWSINRKSKGKTRAWLSWILLIATSLPIHLLSNSFIGMSYTFPSTKVVYESVQLQPNVTEGFDPNYPCWSAFRTGQTWWLEYLRAPSTSYDTDAIRLTYALASGFTGALEKNADVIIEYDEEKCSSMMQSATSMQQLQNEFNSTNGPCINGVNVRCSSGIENQLPCSISIRMQAALTLAAALLIKAVYMVLWNFLNRGSPKTKCLTFGDVIAASALNPDIQVPNECLVNASDAYREKVEHSCHKHCKSPAPSDTGDELGHCQKCTKWNQVNKTAGLEHPIVATKIKKSLISNLGGNAVTQMVLLSFCSMAMLGVSLYVAVVAGADQQSYSRRCHDAATDSNLNFNRTQYDKCMDGAAENWKSVSGGWGGFNESVTLTSLSINDIGSESASFVIANGAQLVYSLLYLLVIYNITLISMEHDWGSFEKARHRIRCTLYKGKGFNQSYLLQLPRRVIFPIMAFSALMHWLLGQAITTKEWVWHSSGAESIGVAPFQFFQYQVVYAAYPLWLSTILMIAMTSVCWWAFTYSREGYMPQMYGSIRVCCASTTGLQYFPSEGIQWGDLGAGKRFRHAGFSDSEVSAIVPGELYCGYDRETMD